MAVAIVTNTRVRGVRDERQSSGRECHTQHHPGDLPGMQQPRAEHLRDAGCFHGTATVRTEVTGLFKENALLLQVKAAVLDPENDFSVERTLTKEDVQKLIQVRGMARPKESDFHFSGRC